MPKQKKLKILFVVIGKIWDNEIIINAPTEAGRMFFITNNGLKPTNIYRTTRPERIPPSIDKVRICQRNL